MNLRTSAKWLFLKFKRFQVGCKYYFANTHKMGFYGAFSVAGLLQAVSSTIYPEGCKLYIPIRIAYYTGMRKGEILALKWSDIDLFGRSITVNKTQYANAVNAPKTKSSYRQVSFGQRLMSALVKQKH